MALRTAALLCMLAAALFRPSPARAGCVSPDGKQIAYCVPVFDAEAEPLAEVYVAPVDGGEPRKLAALPGMRSQVTWLSPDRLAVSDPFFPRRIRVLDMAGKSCPDLPLPKGSGALYTAYFPGRQQACFTGSREQEGRTEHGLFIWGTATGEARRLLASDTVRTVGAWSADGRRVAIGVPSDGKSAYARDYDLRIIDAATGQAEETGALGVGAAWSPDGTRIACTTAVKHGGNWLYGVPTDGMLGLYHVDTRQMQVIPHTEGAVLPAWSPDGKWIAYLAAGRVRVVASDGDLTRQLHQTGGDALVRELVWADDEALIVCTDCEVRLAHLSTPDARVLAAWKMPEPPVLKQAEYRTLAAPRVTVTYARIGETYAQAYARILSQVLTTYEAFGFAMPAAVSLRAEVDPQKVGAWSDGESALFLKLESKEQLRDPAEDAGPNLNAIGCELSGIAFHRQMADTLGLPTGVAKGWARYAAAAVLSEVAAKPGQEIWPQPYDVSGAEGMGPLQRLAQTQAETPWEKRSPIVRASTVFHRLEKEHGRKKVMAAMAEALASRPAARELMPRFLEALRASTGDARAGDWMPKSALVAHTEWRVAERNPNEDVYLGQRVEKDEGGIILAYGDGVMASKDTAPGSGHVVLFRGPQGAWQLDGIRIFGARNGELEAPKDEFALYVCDRDLNVLHVLRFPYARFERGEERWVDLRLGPVDVPRQFTLCAGFDTTRARGVQVGIDRGVLRSHSWYGLPESYVSDMDERGDWMIRAHLRPKP